jgi:hypothetical protein
MHPAPVLTTGVSSTVFSDTAGVIRRGGSAGEAMKRVREALIQAAINVVVDVTLSGILCAIFLTRHVYKWRNSEHLPHRTNVRL